MSLSFLNNNRTFYTVTITDTEPMKTHKITERRFADVWHLLTQELQEQGDFDKNETYYTGKRDFRRFLELYLKIDVVPDSPTD